MTYIATFVRHSNAAILVVVEIVFVREPKTIHKPNDAGSFIHSVFHTALEFIFFKTNYLSTTHILECRQCRHTYIQNEKFIILSYFSVVVAVAGYYYSRSRTRRFHMVGLFGLSDCWIPGMRHDDHTHHRISSQWQRRTTLSVCSIRTSIRMRHHKTQRQHNAHNQQTA